MTDIDLVYFSGVRVESKPPEMHLPTGHVCGNATSKGLKRKADIADLDEIFIPPKRISPFLNTPKERKDEKRKILRISLQKVKAIEDAELSLRRSVLINNTMMKMKRELRKEAKHQSKYSVYNGNRKKRRLGYGMLNNDCLSDSYLVDDPFLSGVHEKITDDMTDILMNNLESKIGSRIACLSSIKDTSRSDISMAKSPSIASDCDSSMDIQATEMSGCDSSKEINNTDASKLRSSKEPISTVGSEFHTSYERNLTEIGEDDSSKKSTSTVGREFHTSNERNPIEIGEYGCSKVADESTVDGTIDTRRTNLEVVHRPESDSVESRTSRESFTYVDMTSKESMCVAACNQI